MKPERLSLELSKRLNDLGLLDDIETEYIVRNNGIIYKLNDFNLLSKEIKAENGWFKTLTESEAIKFLPSFILEKQNFKDEEGNVVLRSYNIIFGDFETGKMKELIFAIEKYFEYLLNNNLLTK